MADLAGTAAAGALLRSRGYLSSAYTIVSDIGGSAGNSDATLFRKWMPRLFADCDERVFFRGCYAAAEEAATARRGVETAAVRRVLEAAGVEFEIRDDGSSTLNIHFPNTSENLRRLMIAAAPLGADITEGSWSVALTGGLMFHKEDPR